MDPLRQLFKDCSYTWNNDRQYDHAVEEAAEFVSALMHWRSGRGSVEDLAKEIADLELMLGQIKYYIGEELVEAEKVKKIALIKEKMAEVRKGMVNCVFE